MQKLSSSTHQQFRELCAQAYEQYDATDYQAALRLFYRAWTLIPKPQMDYEESGWVLSAIGDAYFKQGQYKQGKEALVSAMHCANMRENPFVHLRLGQCQYHEGDEATATKHLHYAWQRGGEKLFASEAPLYKTLAQAGESET